MRSVTWVRIQEFAHGDWTIDSRRLRAIDVHAVHERSAA
jgi:hypothetical protein